MHVFDLVIVGAGPAGSAAAMAGRLAGLSVVIIDKAPFPRDKLCGGLFTGRAARVMGDVFGLTPDARFLECRDVVLRMGGVAVPTRSAHPIWLTMRRDLDLMLLNAATGAGAVPLLGQPVQSVDVAQNRVTLRDGAAVGYRFLIGADGVNSAVRRAVWGAAPLPRLAFALEAEVDRAAVPDADRIVIDFDAARWGYGWAFPKRQSVTVGVGGRQARNPDMKAAMARFAGQIAPGASPRVKGHFLPFGGMVRRPLRGNIGLVGDAAGLVDPVTGEGIAHAMHSGALMAQHAALALQGRDATKPLTELRALRRELHLARLAQGLILSGLLPLSLRQRLLANPQRQARFFDLLAGVQDYSTLIRRRFWPFGGQ